MLRFATSPASQAVLERRLAGAELLLDSIGAHTSAGLLIENNTGGDVLLLGAGGSQGATFYGQANTVAISDTSAAGITTIQASTQDGMRLLGRAGGTSSYIGTFTPAALTGSRTWTMPDATGTVGLLSLAQTWSALQTYSAGLTVSSGTTTLQAVGCAALTATGVVTVPDGSAAAPGIRTTTEQHGLYRVSATSLGFTVAGTAAAALSSAGAFSCVGGLFPTTSLSGSSSANGNLISTTSTNTGGTVRGIQSQLTMSPGSASTAFCIGIDAQTFAGGNAAAIPSSEIIGLQGEVRINAGTASGTVSSASSLRGGINNQNASITITAGYGINLYNPQTTGPITTYTAVRVAALSGPGTSYAFRSEGAGLISFGDTTDASAIGTAGLVHAGGASIAKNLWIGGTAGNYINIANATGELRINGTKVLGAQGAAVADASGGATVDAEARTAINTLLARLRTHGAIAT